MKNSLGTLAAIAASVTAMQSEAAVVVSSISNLPLDETLINLDIDGNGTTDFVINSDFEFLEGFSGTGDVIINLDSSDLESLPSGYLITGSDDFGSLGDYSVYSTPAMILAGLEFQRSGQTHYGWLSMSLPDTGDGVVVSAAWESDANTGIFAGAIPEPQNAALGAGLLAAVLAGLRRSRGLRRRE